MNGLNDLMTGNVYGGTPDQWTDDPTVHDAYIELQRAGFQLACVQRRYRRAVAQYDRAVRAAAAMGATVGSKTAGGATNVSR